MVYWLLEMPIQEHSIDSMDLEKVPFLDGGEAQAEESALKPVSNRLKKSWWTVIHILFLLSYSSIFVFNWVEHRDGLQTSLHCKYKVLPP